MRIASVVLVSLALGTLAVGCKRTTSEPIEPEPQPVDTDAAEPSEGDSHDSTGTQGGGRRTPARGPKSDPVADAWVAAHDMFRSQVSPAADPALPEVTWSADLAKQAQAWAERCQFDHSQTDLGENLSARTDAGSPEETVAAWAGEGVDFDYAHNRCAKGKVCGHYTQLVWRDSTQIGCGTAQCGPGGPFGDSPWVMAVCNYSPAGNWKGQKPY